MARIDPSDMAPDDSAEWAALLSQALMDTGGPLSAEERAWADEVLRVHGE